MRILPSYPFQGKSSTPIRVERFGVSPMCVVRLEVHWIPKDVPGSM